VNLVTAIVSLMILMGIAAGDTDTQDKKQKTPKPDPLTEYHLENIEGWDVHVHKSLLRKHREVGDRLKAEVQHQLFQIRTRVPAGPLAELQKVPIWLEYKNDHRNPCACYHVSKGWLKENGFLEEKAKSVEICNAETFLKWVRQQPSMLLHELSHGYHDRVLGYDDAKIIAVWEQAKAEGKYDEVLHIDGGKRKHYALENQMEYFAEATEAYFGTNDFYPFVRAELKQHDERGFKLMQEIWDEK
jgi:hypothetical protein